MAQRKFYVVWEGLQPGIYDSWEECKLQIDGYKGAKYRAYDSCEAATEAFRKKMDAEEMQFYTFLTLKREMKPKINYSDFPDIKLNAIAVDAACNKNPGGDVEYQGVVVGTRERLFHVGPFPGGSNNIGEYIGIVHALAYLAQRGDPSTPIYTDSRTALSWVRRRHSHSTVQFPEGSRLKELLDRADRWIATHTWLNPIYKWETELWGEIPADFGRK